MTVQTLEQFVAEVCQHADVGYCGDVLSPAAREYVQRCYERGFTPGQAARELLHFFDKIPHY